MGLICITALADASDAEVMSALLAVDDASPPAPNCIFDVHHYNVMRARYGRGDPLNPIVHYLTLGAPDGLGINALFDEVYYLRHARLSDASPVDAVIHALKKMQNGLGPFSPFVDFDYICAKTGKAKTSELLIDLFAGAFQPNQPHPLVDLAYIDLNSTHRIETLQDAIRRYWTGGDDLSTHPLIDVEYYKSQFPEDAGIVKSAYHYLVSQNPFSPHVLFDPAFYREEAIEKQRRAPARPLEHFVSTGQALGLSPSPFFDTMFYRRQADCGEDALQHYLAGGHRTYAPHPMIDLEKARLFSRTVEPSSKDFAQLMADEAGRLPMDVIPEFDPVYYRKKVGIAEDEPDRLRRHYFREGYLKGARPNGLLSIQYIEAQCRRFGVDSQTPLAGYFEQRWNHRKRILIALSSMQDTALNRTWYELCKSQLGNPDLELIVIGAESGPMSDLFSKVAHIWHLRQKSTADIEESVLCDSIENLRRVLTGNPAEVIFVDCSVGLALPRVFARLGARQIAFGDRGLAQLSEEEAGLISGHTDQILCSSPQLRGELERKFPAGGPHVSTGFNLHVAPNRVLESQRRQAREALGLTEDDILIASSGGPEIAHGADLFGALAAQFFEGDDIGTKTIFLWNGPGAYFGNQPKFYARHFAASAPKDNRFRIIDEADITSTLRAADIYVKLGRDTCELHDAMQALASGVPVILMQDSIETAALGAHESVLMVDAFDLTAMRRILGDLVADPDMRQSLGAKAQAAAEADSNLATLVSSLNKALVPSGRDVAFTPPNDLANGRLLLVLPDQSLLESLEAIAIEKTILGSTPALWLDHQQIGPGTFPEQVRDLIRNSACSQTAVVSNADILTSREISDFNRSVLLVRGTTSELDLLYLKGLEFDEIYTPGAGQIAEMHKLNPRIAASMRVLDWMAS